MAQMESLQEKSFSDNSSEKIQGILRFLLKSDGLSKHLDDFIQILSLVDYKDASSFVLAPLASEEWRESNFLRY